MACRRPYISPMPKDSARYPVTRPDAEWKRMLSPAAYRTLRHEATERPGTSPLNREHRPGLFLCAGCNWPLYSSEAKYESGTGWPSFWQPLTPRSVATRADVSLLMGVRTEVHCANCGGHLGHLFPDGPRPTGRRYCMNGVALKFQPGRTRA
jgi:peptide-methionine (R)-S-oxide reductase